MIFVGIARNSAVLRIAKDQLGVRLAGAEGEHRMSSDRTDRRNDPAERMKADRQSVVTLFLFPRGTFPSKEIGLLRRTVTGSSHPSPDGRRCGEPAVAWKWLSITVGPDPLFAALFAFLPPLFVPAFRPAFAGLFLMRRRAVSWNAEFYCTGISPWINYVLDFSAKSHYQTSLSCSHRAREDYMSTEYGWMSMGVFHGRVCSRLALLLLGALPASPVYAVPTIYDLGTIGGVNRYGRGINASGQVTGTSYTTGNQAYHAFRYSGMPGNGGAMADLGTLGGAFSEGYGINATGQVAGTSHMTGNATYHAFRYTGTPGSGGAMADLGTLGGTFSEGRGINDAGQVSGFSRTTGDAADHAMRYTGTPGSGGAMADLGTIGGVNSYGRGINASGQVSGTSYTTGNQTYHAFRYTGTPGSGGAMADLGTLGGAFSEGYGINATGQVVGGSWTTGDTAAHAFRYTGTPGSGGVMADLGTIGGTFSEGYAINAAAQVAGTSQTSGDVAYHAFLYTGTPGGGGVMIDLDAWLDANNPIEGAKWTLRSAQGLTDTGLVSGTGLYDDGPGGLTDRAFMLDASALVPRTWSVNASGNWSDAGNWQGGVPNSAGIFANFGGAITAARTITLDSPQTVGVISLDNVNRYNISGSWPLNLDVVSGAVAINVVSGSHTIACPLLLAKNTVVTVMPPAATLTVSGDFFATASGVNITKLGVGKLEVKHVRANGLTISTGTVKVLTNGTDAGASKISNLTISGSNDAWTSTLDLSDNVMVLDYDTTSPVATVQNQVKSGFNLGDWAGNGITSSSAADPADPLVARIGIAEATDIFAAFPATFRGQAVDETSVVISYTLAGDATLDSLVNLDDFTVLAVNFGRLGRRWAYGDFDYDGTVALNDFTLLAANFGRVLPVGLRSESVPEPAGTLLLVLTGIGLTALRHRPGGSSRMG